MSSESARRSAMQRKVIEIYKRRFKITGVVDNDQWQECYRLAEAELREGA